MPDRRRVETLASDLRFEPEVLEKVIRLLELLADITRHPRLKAALVLKGGTAFNLFFGPPERLSVDLDFNFVGAVELQEMLRQRPNVEMALENLAAAHGYRCQRSKDAHAGRTLTLSYRNLRGLPDSIKVDVDYQHRQCLFPSQARVPWRPDSEVPEVNATLLSFDEIAAGKMVACLDRVAARDLWDVARIPNIASGAWPGPSLEG